MKLLWQHLGFQLIEKIKQLLKIGVVSNSGADAGPIPIQQVSYKGKEGNSVAWHDFGFHSIPTENSYCLVIVPNGNNEERVHIATSALKRPIGKPGDVFIFSPTSGSQIKMCVDGNIEVTAAGDITMVSPTKIEMTAPEIEAIGNTTVTGTFDVTGAAQFDTTVDVDGIATFNAAAEFAARIGATSSVDSDYDLAEHVHYLDGDSNIDVDGPKDPTP